MLVYMSHPPLYLPHQNNGTIILGGHLSNSPSHQCASAHISSFRGGGAFIRGVDGEGDPSGYSSASYKSDNSEGTVNTITGQKRKKLRV